MGNIETLILNRKREIVQLCASELQEFLERRLRPAINGELPFYVTLTDSSVNIKGEAVSIAFPPSSAGDREEREDWIVIDGIEFAFTFEVDEEMEFTANKVSLRIPAYCIASMKYTLTQQGEDIEIKELIISSIKISNNKHTLLISPQTPSPTVLEVMDDEIAAMWSTSVTLEALRVNTKVVRAWILGVTGFFTFTSSLQHIYELVDTLLSDLSEKVKEISPRIRISGVLERETHIKKITSDNERAGLLLTGHIHYQTSHYKAKIPIQVLLQETGRNEIVVRILRHKLRIVSFYIPTERRGDVVVINYSPNILERHLVKEFLTTISKIAKSSVAMH